MHYYSKSGKIRGFFFRNNKNGKTQPHNNRTCVK